MSPARPIPVVDLTRYDEALKSEIARNVGEVFATGRFVLGPANETFEKAFAGMLGVKHALGVSSGTDALLVSLMALGVGPGDEVITSPFSFFASAGVVARLGAVPVFVDIEPASFNLDPSRLEAAVTRRTKAIQPVHLYGQCADMDPILEVAKRRRLPVLEDACQAVGAAYAGKHAGAMGTLGAFSFYPTKNLGAAGDAGAVTTDDDDLAAQVRILRLHGGSKQYHHDRVGGNFRLDSVQAAVLNAKLPLLPGWNERRRAIAARYGELFAGAAKEGRIGLPVEAPGRRHVWHQYVVRVAGRDGVKPRLAEKGIGTSVFYPVPLNEQKCFRDLGQQGRCPVASKAATEVLALPIFPELTDAEVDRVVEAVIACLP
ncbi:MAG TPA: DegT/DnrJ/EryC1/StrS family aminotransferase [Thermoanaerobaculia bacterium]|nr:DegT/DnrJ/EryC1/StrS family aminotransferase [Thermoanaerobaculia bacterium]